MKLPVVNLLSLPAADSQEEFFETVLEQPDLRVERIISTGQATPAGEWYDQSWDEWVLLLAGAASLLIEGETEPRHLMLGDSLLLPAHCRHRVEWTDPNRQTIWLALHISKSFQD